MIGTVVWGTVFWGDNSVGESRVRPRIMNDVGNDLVDEFGGNNDAEYSPTTVTEGPGEPGQNVSPMRKGGYHQRDSRRIGSGKRCPSGEP